LGYGSRSTSSPKSGSGRNGSQPNPEATPYVYAAGCLLDVSKVIAGTFRQR
jgi:hypothetical protein